MVDGGASARPGPDAVDPQLIDGTDGSGVAGLEYSLDDGNIWIEYTDPFVIEEEGTTRLLFRASDAAGNVSEPMVKIVSIDTQAPEISLSVDPEELWPPNNKPVSVELSGEASDSTSGLVSVIIEVEDEYGEWEPDIEAVALARRAVFDIDAVIDLIASRRGQDMDGRTYTIRVTVEDQAGNVAEASATVIVPHDQRDNER